jgi:biotin operon repressor
MSAPVIFSEANRVGLGLIRSWLPDGRQEGDEWVALNPTRDDKRTGSFKINLETGVWSDFATGDKGGDAVSLYAYLHGLKQAEAARAILGQDPAGAGGNGHERQEREKPPAWILPIPPEREAAVRAYTRAKGTEQWGSWAASWEYRDAQGRLLCIRARYNDASGGKQIIPFGLTAEGPRARDPFKGKPAPLYNLPALAAASHEAPVLLVEGEKCADVAAGYMREGLPFVAMTWPGGCQAKKANIDWSPLKGRRVTLWPDKDQPGREAMAEIAAVLRSLGCRVSTLEPPAELPEGGDVADLNEAGWSAKQIGEFVESAELQKSLPELAAEAGAVLDCVADIQARPLSWVWPGRIPAGKLTLLVGDPGLGKSVLTLDLTARITRGALWPDKSGRCELGNVVLLSAEDDPEDTIRPRLEAAGADLLRVFILRSVIRADGKEHAFSLTEDLAKLRACITPETRMVIVDPLSAYMGEGIDSHRDTAVRAVLAPLAQLAADTRVAVGGVSHLNKAGRAGIYRIQGSIAFGAAARAVWAVCKDPDDPTRCMFLPVKNNLAPQGSGLLFELKDAGGHPVVHWGDPIATDARSVMELEAETGGRSADRPGVRKQALEVLRAAGRPMKGKELAEAMGKTEGAVWKLMERLHQADLIEHSPEGYTLCA